MFEKIGVKYLIVTSPSELNDKDKIILPGVGSYDRAVKNIKKMEFT